MRRIRNIIIYCSRKITEILMGLQILLELISLDNIIVQIEVRILQQSMVTNRTIHRRFAYNFMSVLMCTNIQVYNPIYKRNIVTCVCPCVCLCVCTYVCKSDPFSKIIHSNHHTIPAQGTVPVLNQIEYLFSQGWSFGRRIFLYQFFGKLFLQMFGTSHY